MAGPWLSRDNVHFVQLETVWATSPGALAATDAFRSRTRYPFKRNKSRIDRDQDADQNQASVITTQGGRESADFAYDGDLIPAGVAGTPTESDMDPFFEAHFGAKHKATAHTTTAAGCTATVLNFTGGGVAASGTQVGDIIVVDVDATFGLEARQVTNIATDAVTVHAALSAAPAAARNVYVGTTYRLLETATKSVHLWNYQDGDNFRHKVGGAVVQQLTAACDFTGPTPIATVAVSGPGEKIQVHASAMPTQTTAGQPLLPDKSYAFFAGVRTCITKAGFDSNNGIELRSNESCALFPTAVKRSGNSGRYMVNANVSALLTSGAIEGYFDGASALTAYDLTVQLGASPGKIVVWRVRKFIPDAVIGDQDSEVSLDLTGRAYGTSGDDEIVFATI